MTSYHLHVVNHGVPQQAAPLAREGVTPAQWLGMWGLMCCPDQRPRQAGRRRGEAEEDGGLAALLASFIATEKAAIITFAVLGMVFAVLRSPVSRPRQSPGLRTATTASDNRNSGHVDAPQINRLPGLHATDGRLRPALAPCQHGLSRSIDGSRPGSSGRATDHGDRAGGVVEDGVAD